MAIDADTNLDINTALTRIENAPSTELAIKGQPLSEAQFNRILDIVRTNKPLTGLYLTNVQMNDANAVALANAMKDNVTLKSLGLADNQIGDEGAKALASVLSHGHELQELNLHFNRIGDQGAIAFSEALRTDREGHRQPTLKRLNLGQNTTHDQTIFSFAEAIEHIPSLVSLDVLGTQRLSDPHNVDNSLRHITHHTTGRAERVPASAATASHAARVGAPAERFVDAATSRAPVAAAR